MSEAKRARQSVGLDTLVSKVRDWEASTEARRKELESAKRRLVERMTEVDACLEAIYDDSPLHPYDRDVVVALQEDKVVAMEEHDWQAVCKRLDLDVEALEKTHTLVRTKVKLFFHLSFGGSYRHRQLESIQLDMDDSDTIRKFCEEHGATNLVCLRHYTRDNTEWYDLSKCDLDFRRGGTTCEKAALVTLCLWERRST